MTQARAPSSPPRISYGQNGEDILLARAFADRPGGFYIDVGAWHPTLHSVTKHFSTAGWRGINVEPNPQMHALLARDRPADVNLAIALGAAPGRARLLTRVDSSLSALVGPDELPHLLPGEQAQEVEVQTLAAVCERHVAGPIDFLKVDVEGAERDVLLGADWQRFRPRLVLVEATAPQTEVPTWDAWESILTDARYSFVYFDGLNRFYIDSAEPDLARHFDRPVNVCDGFLSREVAVLNRELRLREQEIAKLGRRLVDADRLNEELRASVSWRLTEPGRQVTSRLHAIQRLLARHLKG